MFNLLFGRKKKVVTTTDIVKRQQGFANVTMVPTANTGSVSKSVVSFVEQQRLAEMDRQYQASMTKERARLAAIRKANEEEEERKAKKRREDRDSNDLVTGVVLGVALGSLSSRSESASSGWERSSGDYSGGGNSVEVERSSSYSDSGSSSSYSSDSGSSSSSDSGSSSSE